MSDGHTNSRRRSAGVVLLWLCGLATLLAATMAATGGFTFYIGGLRVALHAVIRPVIAAIVFGVAGVAALQGEARSEVDRIQSVISRHGLLIACVFAAVIGVSTFVGGAHIGGGSDSSGYLSEARLWRAAGGWNLDALRTPTPLAHELTLTNGQYPFTPVGYRPASTPGMVVPGYPPGLPLLFAIAGAIGGDRAQFAVVSLSAAGLAIVAFLLARRIAGDDAALIAAAATGASPILIYQATQPMSDVVAAFWLTLAVLLLLSRSYPALAAGGVAAAIACLVRPNLFAMIPVIALLSWWWRRFAPAWLIRLAVFLAPVAAAALAFASLQQTLYGNASTTGYGEVSSLFSLDYVWPNLARYPRWAIFTQSGLLLAALAAPIAIRRKWVSPAGLSPVGLAEGDPAFAERVAWGGLLFFACLQGFYLLYIPFEDWVFFRFLLPALPWVLVLQATTMAAASRLVPSPVRGLVLVLVAVLAASWGVGRARALGAFRLQDSEQRYLDVAEFTRGLPPDAVFISMQHSGSLAYNRSATILRWDWLEPGEIDRAVSELSQKGRAVFAVLEDWEEKQFRARFTGTRTADSLGAPLFTAGVPHEIIAKVYAIRGAPNAAAGAPVSSRPLPAPRNPRRPAAPGP